MSKTGAYSFTSVELEALYAPTGTPRLKYQKPIEWGRREPCKMFPDPFGLLNPACKQGLAYAHWVTACAEVIPQTMAGFCTSK